jgi:MFS family permease
MHHQDHEGTEMTDVRTGRFSAGTWPGRLRRAVGLPRHPAAARWAVASVADAIGTGLLLPVTVLFFTQQVGLSAASVGVGLGIAGGAALAVSPVGGVLTDRMGAKPTMIGCWLLSAIGFLSFLMVDSWPAFVLAAAVGQIADQTVKPAKQSFVAGLAEGEERLRLLAFQRSVRNLGFAVGGLLATAVLTSGGSAGYRVLIIGNAASYVIAAVLVTGIASKRPTVARTREHGWRGYGIVLRDKRYVALATLDAVVLLHTTTFTIGLPLWVSEHTEAPTAVVAALFTLNTVLIVVFQVLATKGVTGLRDVPPVYIRAAAAFLVATGLYLVAGHAGPWVSTALLVVGAGLHTATELWGSVGEWTVSVDLAPEAHRGKYLAVFGFGNSVQQAIGPAVVAVVIAGGSDLGWPIIGIVTAGACVATAFCAVPPGRHAAATVRRREATQCGRRSGDLVPADLAATP